MPISCHFRHYKALLVTICVSGDIASTRTFTFYLNPTSDQNRKLDRHQRLIDCSLGHHAPLLQKFSLKSVRNFLSNLADRQTDRQTNRQRYKHNLITSAKMTIIHTPARRAAMVVNVRIKYAYGKI